MKGEQNMEAQHSCGVLVLVLGMKSVSAQPIAAGSPSQEIFYDTDGLIVHHGPNGELDGGDTSQREGWYWLGVWARQNTPGLQPWDKQRVLTFRQVVDLLEPAKDGVFYRHPKLPPWNDPHGKAYGLSRDQIEPMVAAMGVWGMHAEIERLWEALPEDLLGKHTFNGNWRNFLGQDGQDCSAIKRRGCDATDDCSLKVDDRDCSLKTDNRDCSLAVDNRDCSLQEDRRDCNPNWGCRSCDGWDAINPACHAERAGCEADKVRYRNQCEVEKGTQNGIYKAQHDACEAGKAAQNLAYKGEHDACELAKFQQNAAYKVQHDACEAAKFAQNVTYKAEHDACEVAKTTSKLTCEAQKAADSLLCMVTNVHSGDLIGPMTVNLFRRAIGEDPMVPVSLKLRLPPVNIGCGTFGETELAMNVGLRIAAANKDRGDTGDDLNLIVKLLMAKVQSPTLISEGATKLYAEARPYSFGSFLRTYREVYGSDVSDIEVRIAEGMRSGWQPDVSPPIGAVRWYHRADTGANPQLAELYEIILNHFVK